ncbi:MAG: terminase family protein [Oscillospiraceae bacterium]|jgi:hypothetical protein|nr:terminase family protein [Oscillospiraceae bacterium]
MSEAAGVVWEPQERQAAFMARGEDEALYGGAAGGGKSEALVIEALRQVHIPHYRALILRKTYPQLTELIDKAERYYPRAFPGVKYNSSSHSWRFPSGARIIFGDLHRTQDRHKYQGHAYDFMGFDELTHFAYDEYVYLRSRNRATGPGTRVYMRSTANPGGVGHVWVKDRFVTAAPPMTTVREPVEWVDPEGTRHTSTTSRIFVPATVFDNRLLLEHDPAYVHRLASLPDAERRALLYGDWDSFSGQVFAEWRNAPNPDRSHTHVIEPFRIPESWGVWRGLDWGYSRPFSVGWYAVDRDRRLYRIRELYGCTGRPNEGTKWEPSRVARAIREIERDDPNLRGRQIHGIADPAIWQSDGTESIGSIFERAHVYFERGDHARISGKMQVHYRLAFDPDGFPMLYVFDTCRHFIRTFPALVYDESDVEDVDTDGEDHAYDELRYICMANPIAPPERPVEVIRPYSPLDTDTDVGYDHYAYFRR